MNDHETQTLTQTNGQDAKPFGASRNDLAQLGQGAREAAQDVKERVSAHAGRAKEHLTHLVGNARNESRAQLGEIKNQAAKIPGQAADLIKRRPFTFLGTALVVGLVLASVLRRGAKAAK